MTEMEHDVVEETQYQVKLNAFTGPLDLLLHLIRKHEINVYDIPISNITQQYLEYLNLMKTLNLSMAGEFLVMAATLLYIKSRMLLPKDEKVEKEEEGEDPREELVRRLVEYEQFKDAAIRLSSQERLWRDAFFREPQPIESPGVPEELLIEDLSLFDLLGALQEVLDRTASHTLLEISPESITVQERVNALLDRLEGEPALMFQSLFDSAFSRPLVIVTFLALLELVRMRLVRLSQGEVFGPIRVTRTFSPGLREESGESLANGVG